MDFVWTSDVAMNDSVPIAPFHELHHPPKIIYNSYYKASLEKKNCLFSFSLCTVTKICNTGPKNWYFQSPNRMKTYETKRSNRWKYLYCSSKKSLTWVCIFSLSANLAWVSILPPKVKVSGQLQHGFWVKFQRLLVFISKSGDFCKW